MLLSLICSFVFTLLLPKQVEIEITFFSQNRGGDIRLAWYTKEGSFMEEAAGTATTKFDSDSLTFSIIVPNQPLAITSFHDLNEDQELSTNLLGIPTEPYGFSMNARGKFGPPTFTECLFDPSTTKKLTIHLK